MVGFDDQAEIHDFSGKNVGWLNFTIALGSPTQVNFFDKIQIEREKAREAEREEEQRREKRKQRKDDIGNTDKAKNQEIETLLRELIDTLKDKGASGGSKRSKGKWDENQLDSLRKLFEE